MNTVMDDAYKLGCGRYIQQKNAIALAGREAARLGRYPLIIGGPNSYHLIGDKLEASLAEAQLKFQREIYGGYCTEEKAEAIAARMHEDGHDVLIAVGGGKLMDLGKTAADIARAPIINIPTSSATCAAYTPLSVIYTDDGACRGTWYFENEINCVIADMDVLSVQPKRLMMAGILDAMAKWIEIGHHGETLSRSGSDGLAAKMLADLIYRRLKPEGLAMAEAAAEDEKQAFDLVFLTICQTGVISGIARGRYQSALAHALYEEVRTHGAGRDKLHGEIVAVGLIAQEHFLGHAKEAEELAALLKAAGMPSGLMELGVDCSDESLAQYSACRPAQRFLNGEEDRLRFLDALGKTV